MDPKGSIWVHYMLDELFILPQYLVVEKRATPKESPEFKAECLGDLTFGAVVQAHHFANPFCWGAAGSSKTLAASPSEGV